MCLTWLIQVLFMLMLSACVTTGDRKPSMTADPTLDQSIGLTMDQLTEQLQKQPAFASGFERQISKTLGQIRGASVSVKRPVLVVDTFIDGATGQQTNATKFAESRMYEQSRSRLTLFEVQPARASSISSAEYVLTSVLFALPGQSGKFRLAASLIEIKSGRVVAQTENRISDNTLDQTPTIFYRESPTLVKDRIVDGQIRTAQSGVGQVADREYLDRISAVALVNEGMDAFNAGRYSDAARIYTELSQRPDGQQVRVLNGLYVSLMNLMRADEAEVVFGKVVSLGLATNNLSVKFLFRPGSTEFWSDARLTSSYPMWIRQLSRQLQSTNKCVVIVGHTSKTGSEQTNERLSLQRADSMRQRLFPQGQAANRIKTEGRGWQENMVGSGTDDQRDALDRRVEFRVVNCG